MFCSTDEEVICVVCHTSEKHGQHTCQPINEVAGKYKRKYQSEMAVLYYQRVFLVIVSVALLMFTLFITDFRANAPNETWFIRPPNPKLVHNNKDNMSILLSSEDQEVILLQNMTWWPEPPFALNFTLSTSPKNTNCYLVDNKTVFVVGDTLDIFLVAKDYRNKAKSHGGDFLQAKILSPILKASAVGSVHDNLNGTYLIRFKLLWPGDVQISIRLIHSSEAVSIMKKVRENCPEKVIYNGYYKEAGKPEEVVQCNLEIKDGPVCTYTDPTTQQTWMCRKPKNYNCTSRVYHSSGYIANVISKAEQQFFNWEVTDVQLSGTPSHVKVEPFNSKTSNNLIPCTPGLEIPTPSGYYMNDSWTSLVCSAQHFNDYGSVTTCLKKKIVYMFGDSTLRQWWDYLTSYVPTLKKIDLHVSYQAGPLLAVDTENQFALHYISHGLPLRTMKTVVNNLHYMENDIDLIAGGPDTVIVFTIWAHYTPYPINVYIKRLLKIRGSLIRILARNPETTIIIKSANTGYKSYWGSDWLSLQLDILMRKIFSQVKVVIIDVWQITSCHYSEENIHPVKTVVKNEVDMFLSFICPKL